MTMVAVRLAYICLPWLCFVKLCSKMNAFGAEMRRQFVLEPGSTFVNHGSYGAAPRRVVDCRLRYVSVRSVQPTSADFFCIWALEINLSRFSSSLRCVHTLPTTLSAIITVHIEHLKRSLSRHYYYYAYCYY